jgi:exodeoxyribonuclease VII small subunit
MNKQMNLEDKSFEELLELLDATVKELDGNALTLEESVAAYERSVAISAACEKLLDDAELRIQQIDARAASRKDTGVDDVPF